jgi:hypothetical protein
VTFAALLREEAQVSLLTYEKSGQRYPRKAGRHWPAEEAQVAKVGDNARSEVAPSRRTYMRRWHAPSRVAEAPEPVKQPQVEVNPALPVKQRKPPPKAERRARRAARAEEMKTLAEDMLRRAARDDGAAGSGLRAQLEARGMTARGYWGNKTSGILRSAVEAYLGGGGELGETGLIALRQYLKRSIPEPNWRCGGLDGLHQRVEGLDTREKLKGWLHDALELGISPL